ncbi:MAG: carboxypeptidase regulatory-like domain-containing protein, partial [Candidatus Cloacimonadaceae bacterium]|nr:carboxypeptidase regulatory-like domain-containing protein [Candidatus Cloacimonadaceae bacterium]
DGNVAYPAGTNTISIVLQQPYTLVAGYNLVMMVQRPYDATTYSFWDNFFCQTDPSSRARLANSSVALDPNNPPTGSFTGQFPKTGFYITPGGSGSLSGSVIGLESQPLQNASVSIQNGPSTITDANGHYGFQTLFASDYAVTVSSHGYDDLTQYVTVVEDSAAVLNFTMIPTATVIVSGTVFGSDDPTTGLAGATIVLGGYADYQAVSDNQGDFQISGVYAGHSYTYTITLAGYHQQTGTVDLGSTDMDMGDIVLTELSYPPTNVTASVINNYTAVDILWLAPVPDDRPLIGYRVWRLPQGEEQNEAAWTLLTPATITLQRFTDTAWGSLPQGMFKWAVKSIYTNGVISSPQLSNALETTGVISGIVRNSQLVPLMGATVTAGSYSTITVADGSYSIHLPGGTYNVICSLNGYYVYTHFNVQVIVGQTSQLDFTIILVDNDDDVLISATKLHGNFPNPFNPETTISFDIKEPSPVVLDIFNLRGQ